MSISGIFTMLYLRSSIVLPFLLSSSKKHYLLCATQFLDTGYSSEEDRRVPTFMELIFSWEKM